jgi:tetratricopeptide (TPR) repeat protein
MSTTSQSQSRWVFGPVPDLLLGCGGAYLVVFLLLAGADGALVAAVPPALMPLLVLVTSVPHYGATLLRVYEQESELRKYRVFAVWLSLCVFAWFAAGVYQPTIGSLMVTLYLTWSPWHYSGQNYGIALMFLGRRGVRVTPTTKRWLYASFVLSFALAFLGIHTAGSVDSYAPGSLGPDAYALIRLGVPPALSAWLLLLVLVGYVTSLGVVATSLLRAGSPRDLAPVGALIGLQALWFSLPVLARATGVLADLPAFSGDEDFREYAFLWVAIGHAVQYLWVTSYYAARSDARVWKSGYLLKAIAAGGAIFGLPLLLFGPDTLGALGYDAGLALLIASAVNLQHFILDGAIWKLRDGRIARVLLRSGAPDPAAPAVGGGVGRWVRGGLLAAGLVYAATFAFGTLEYEFGVRRAGEADDFARMRTAAERLRWIGRDDARLRHNLAIGAMRARDLEAARREVERGLQLDESARSWVLLGMVRQRGGDKRGAAAAYQRALELDPAHVPALSQLARVYVELGDQDRARDALLRAIEIAPDRADLRERLAPLPAPAGAPTRDRKPTLR